MSKLTDSKIRWMIRRKEEGRMTNRKIARSTTSRRDGCNSSCARARAEGLRVKQN